MQDTEADLRDDISLANWREQLWQTRLEKAKSEIASAQADRAKAENALLELKGSRR